MPQSNRFQNLKSQLANLSGYYLTFSKRLTGDYTKRELSAGAAYTIFAHAELESFVEEWATKITDRAEQRWKAGVASRAITHLVTFRQEVAVPSSVPSKDIWTGPIATAVSWHRGAIKNNHGIKERNICLLFAPLGFDVRSIDPLLLGDLGALGSIRGDHAHQSAKVHLGQKFDPFDRQRKIANITTLLADFDRQLLAFLARC